MRPHSLTSFKWVNKSRASGSQLSQNFLLWPPIIVGPQYETCFVSQLWRLEFLDGFLIFGKFVHDWCGGVVVHLHSFLISTLDWAVSCSFLTAAALSPRDAAPDTPLIGGRESHISRLDTLENWRIFAHCKESKRATQSDISWNLRLPVALNTVLYVGYRTVQCQTLRKQTLSNLERYADFDVYMARG
jgi:hypothetical protein